MANANPNINPNINKEKQYDVMQLWYELTGEKFGKINLATNEDVKEASPAGTREYITAIKEKDIPLVWNNSIVVNGDKNLHLVFLHDFNIYDMQNPQKGVEDRTSFKAIKQALHNKNEKDKTVVFFSGDIIGNEFNITTLANASIKDKKILFWGLQKRAEKLIDYLKYVAENGANEIILMNGRSEHNAKKKLNRDILQDVLLDVFNDILLKYVITKANNSKSKVKISYVNGVKKVFNIEKKVGKKTYYYDISVHTNLKTSSKTLSSSNKAAQNQHGNLAVADYIFVPSENAVGSYANIVFASGLARYKDTPKGYVPSQSTKGYNSFTLLLGEESHNVELVRTANFVNEQSYALEKKIAQEEARIEYLSNLCQEKIAKLKQDFFNKEETDSNFYKELYSQEEAK